MLGRAGAKVARNRHSSRSKDEQYRIGNGVRRLVMTHLLRNMVVFLVMALLVISLLVDPFFPFHAYWSFTIPLCLLVALVVAWITSGRARAQRLKLVFAATLAVLSMRYWDFNSRKPFLRSFNALEKGDPKEEVLDQMKDFRCGQGKGFIFVRMEREHPEVADRVENMCFTHTREGWGNSDWGLVYFVDGKLWDTQFSHD
jgi:hypothetical protein